MRLQHSTIQSHKTDLLLINEISKPSSIAQLQAPSNMTQLHKLLQFKNAKASHTRQDKQNAQAWLNRQGIDIGPLMDRVKRAKQITIQKQELKKIQEDCFFYINDMSYKKLQEYEAKAADFGTLTLIQKSMHKEKWSKTLLKKIKNKYQQTMGQVKALSEDGCAGVITSIRTQTRDEQKRQKYLQCVGAMAKKNIKRDELVSQMSTSLHQKFWKIMAKHVKSLKEAKTFTHVQRVTQLYLESLKLVQQEYDSTLARGSESLNYYLTSNYLQKLDKREEKYYRDRQHSSFWGKAFILYRAGRKKDFYNLLATRNQTELLQLFSAVDQAIQQKNPAIRDAPIRQGDVFREQLLYSLRGEGKYSSPVLSDPGTLDFVWILIRNTAIFYEKMGNEFQNYKSKLLESYSKESLLTEQQLYNYFYLLAYGEVAEMGFTEIMDQDDYVHFLICLYDNPQLIEGSSEKVKKLLTTQLMLYIRELISLGRSEYVYYLALIPKENRVTEISTLLSASNLVSTFDWQYLKSSIPTNEEFELIVKRTLEKYILTTNDYLAAAEKYIELLNYTEEAVKCLLQFLLKNFHRNSFDDLNVRKAETACDKYLYRNPPLEPKYRPVLKFLLQSRLLLQLLKERKETQIYQLIKNDEFIVLGAVLPQKQHDFFKTLIELSGLGLEVYFKFLKTTIMGLEIYFFKQNKNHELTQFVTLVQENLKFILSHQQYKTYGNREQANSLKQLINSTHYQLNKKK